MTNRTHNYRHKLPRRALRVETLEDRLVPDAALGAFAHFAGPTVTAQEPASVAVHVRAGDFTMPHGRVLLCFMVHSSGNAQLDPGSAAVVPLDGASGRSILRRADLAGDSSSLTLARVSTGDFAVRWRGQHGTADDATLPITAAVYDDALRTVTLTPRSTKPLKLNQFVRVTAKGAGGVTNLDGAALDGDANDAPGGDFIRALGLGTKLSFVDPTGDVVALTLKRGGLVELSLPATGDPSVRLTGTVAGASVLSGTVRKPRAGTSDGRATISAITGATGVNTAGLVRCSPAVTTNCLTIGAISAAVVDAILESSWRESPAAI